MSLEVIPIVPAPLCGADCRNVALVGDGQFLGLEAEGGGVPCAACRAAVARCLGSARLTSPMRARGVQRASGEMEPATWDETIDRLAFLLGEAARGPRRVLWFSCGRRPSLSRALARRVAANVGDLTHVVSAPPRETLARLAAGLVYADERATPDDPAAADLLVAWGADLREGPFDLALALARVRARGAPVVAVDPRGSGTTAEATLHIAPRPGTDTALALGLCAAVRAAGPRAADTPALLASALAAWPAARVTEVCGVPAAQFEEFVRLVARAANPVLVLGGGVARHAEARATIQALALAGRIGRMRVAVPVPAPDPGAAVPLPIGAAPPRVVPAGRLDAELAARDPRHDVVIVEGGDPLIGWPGGAGTRTFLGRAGIVVVLTDTLSPVARIADLVLPVASVLERPDAVGLWDGTIRAGRGALPVRRDALPEAVVWRRVAARLRWPEAWFPADLLELQRGAESAVLPAGLPGRWEPPVFREVGEGPRTTPELWRARRLFAVTGPAGGSHADPLDPPEVVLAPSDALARGVADGAAVLVHNERARVPAVARHSAAQPPGVVTLAGGGWGVSGPVPGELLPEQQGRGFEGGEVAGPCLVEVGRLA